MKILDLVQGSPEWLATRRKYRGASEAATMMGASPYKSRSDFVREKALGITEDVSANTQALFDAGHAAEEAARKLVEPRLGELKRIVATDDDGYLIASYDGLNDKGTAWEHKLWNEKLAEQVLAKELEPQYYWQLEQQILVGNLRRVIFTVSNGTVDQCLHMEYKAVPGRAEKLLAGWRQFDADVAAYQHVEHIPAAVAAPVMQLPALSIQVNGSISLIDNLALFGAKLKEFVGNVNKTPDNDQDFADLEQAVKVLKTAEDALEAAESNALAQTASIDEMRRTVALYKDLARTNRLLFDKIVKAEKDNIRGRILAEGQDAFKAHILGLNTRLGKPYMPVVPVDFAGAMKGKKTVSSLRDAVSTELARAKIEANEIADKIQINLGVLRELGEDARLFTYDTAQIVLKAPDDFAALVKLRIAEHKAEQEAKAAAIRETIRLEELAKIEAQRIADAAKPAPIESVVALDAEKGDALTSTPTAPATDIRSAPPPISAPWGAETKRPEDGAIIQCVADHWHISTELALVWICDVAAPTWKRA